MKNTIISLLFVSAFSFNISAQECEAYIPTQQGKKYTYVMKNKKGKIQSYYSQELLKKKNEEGGIKFEILHISYDQKKEITNTDTLEFLCKGDVFYIDMTRYLNEEQMNAYEDAEITVTYDNLGYPLGLQPGTQLEDGYVQAVINAGMPITFRTEIVNRKVESYENIDTEAGTFKTLKISEELVSKMGFVNMNMKSVIWIKTDIGNVKSETYDKRGNLVSYAELISIE